MKQPTPLLTADQLLEFGRRDRLRPDDRGNQTDCGPGTTVQVRLAF